MKNIVVIADDLTGAADTGVQFSPYFAETILISYQQLDRIPGLARSSSQATALYTNSRALAAEAANHRLVSLADGISRMHSTWIYKKIDSCMRGNVGSEVDALLDELDYEVSFIKDEHGAMDVGTWSGCQTGRDTNRSRCGSRKRQQVRSSHWSEDHWTTRVLCGALHIEFRRYAAQGRKRNCYDSWA